jgi:phosphatidylserine/phosphatidylglycerophosphate/cardiolipin synthase-like enzyme
MWLGASAPQAVMAAEANLSSTLAIQAAVMGVYFSPSPHVAQAIIQTVDASQREVLVAAYGFTHNGIAQALVRAHQRGVDVRVVMDAKSANSNRYVTEVLQQENIAIRQDDKHAIAHNKVMVIDESLVITGSFNFTNSAATRNAENVLVLKSSELAQRYKADWLKHWSHSLD